MNIYTYSFILYFIKLYTLFNIVYIIFLCICVRVYLSARSQIVKMFFVHSLIVDSIELFKILDKIYSVII